MGVHVSKELVLVADDSGRVTLVDINGTIHDDDVYPMLSQPAAIDIDWLNNHSYIADGHRVGDGVTSKYIYAIIVTIF